MPGELRAPLVTLDPLTEGDPNIRNSLITVDPITEGSPTIRQSFSFVEPLTEAIRNLRASFFFIEALLPVYPEEYMSTDRFPGSLDSGVSLPGLAFTWHKRPRFNTNVKTAASGPSVRNALMQYPIWEFEGTYDLLEDWTGATSSLKVMMGFFCKRRGQFDTFLFKDSDDYHVVNGPTTYEADGVITQFEFARSLGGFVEKVGQVDTGKTVNLYRADTATHTIPNTGPYTVIIGAIAEDLGVVFTIGGVALVKVASSPAAGQYTVDLTTGTYTFNATDHNKNVNIGIRTLINPVDYTVTMPNLAVFSSAPAAGVITADFEFFFVCKFREDALDFDKFADKFWELQTCEFESVPA